MAPAFNCFTQKGLLVSLAIRPALAALSLATVLAFFHLLRKHLGKFFLLGWV